jgi:serine/threonine protein kinase
MSAAPPRFLRPTVDQPNTTQVMNEGGDSITNAAKRWSAFNQKWCGPSDREAVNKRFDGFFRTASDLSMFASDVIDKSCTRVFVDDPPFANSPSQSNLDEAVVRMDPDRIAFDRGVHRLAADAAKHVTNSVWRATSSKSDSSFKTKPPREGQGLPEAARDSWRTTVDETASSSTTIAPGSFSGSPKKPQPPPPSSVAWGTPGAQDLCVFDHLSQRRGVIDQTNDSESAPPGIAHSPDIHRQSSMVTDDSITAPPAPPQDDFTTPLAFPQFGASLSCAPSGAAQPAFGRHTDSVIVPTVDGGGRRMCPDRALTDVLTMYLELAAELHVQDVRAATALARAQRAEACCEELWAQLADANADRHALQQTVALLTAESGTLRNTKEDVASFAGGPSLPDSDDVRSHSPSTPVGSALRSNAPSNVLSPNFAAVSELNSGSDSGVLSESRLAKSARWLTSFNAISQMSVLRTVSAADSSMRHALLRRLQHTVRSTSLCSAAHVPVSKTARLDLCTEHGETMINQYLVLSHLGKGCQGNVYLALDTVSGVSRAVKEISKLPTTATSAASARQRAEDSKAQQRLKREIAIMKKCRHRNVVALHVVIDDPDAQSIYLVMQYAEHGAVAVQAEDGSVTPVAPRLLADFARQLCTGLHYLHSHGVIHRDIKPENILLGGTEEVCLADFGISTMIDDGRTGISQRDLLSFTKVAARGTPVYLAPELLRTDRERSPCASDEPIDVWALGLALYVLLFGRLPWAFESGPAYMRAVVEEDIEYPLTSAADPTDEGWLRDEWLVLLRGMLAKDEGKRLSALEAHAAAKQLHGRYAGGMGDADTCGPDVDTFAVDSAVTTIVSSRPPRSVM